MSKRLANFFQKTQQSLKNRKKIRASEAAADLRVLILNSGKTFKDIAILTGVTAPALSKKLGGEANLTLESIDKIADVLGYDFDIVFRLKGEPHAVQPWQTQEKTQSALNLASELLDRAKAIYAEQVAMKHTWAEISRHQFRRGRLPSIPTNTLTFAANDDVRMDSLVVNL